MTRKRMVGLAGAAAAIVALAVSWQARTIWAQEAPATDPAAATAKPAKTGKAEGKGAVPKPEVDPAAAREAKPDEKTEKKPLTPTEITADSLEYGIEAKLIVFSGNVKVLDSQLDIAADKMLVTLNDQNEVSKIVAVGNVVLSKADSQALGETAEYDVEKGLVVLSGKPVLKNPAGEIRGALRVVYAREEGTFRTDGGQPKLTYYHPEGGKSLEDIIKDKPKPENDQTHPTPEPKAEPKAEAPKQPPTTDTPPAATDTRS